MSEERKYSYRHEMRLAKKEAKAFVQSLDKSSDSEDDMETEMSENKRCRLDDPPSVSSSDLLVDNVSFKQNSPSLKDRPSESPFSSDADEPISESESSSDDESTISYGDFDLNFLTQDEDDDLTINKSDYLKKALTYWAVKYNTPLNAFTTLLEILNKYTDLNLPNDARTLMGTPRNVQISQVDGGQYYHFGLKNVLAIICSHYKTAGVKPSTINLMINIDGLPLTNSSSSCFWPILCSEPILKNVFMIGSFYGHEKPRISNEYLSEFVQEIIPVIQDGFIYEDKIYPVKLYSLVSDTPAKSFILNVKGHAGFNSCTKCTIHGDYFHNRTCFPPKTNVVGTKVIIVEEPERTHDSFLRKVDDEYHSGESILENIPNFDIVSDVPLDYMHLVCLGVVKKLIGLWLKGPLTVRIQARKMNQISEGLERIKNLVPSDFARRPRPLHTWPQWKATEFRALLLYTGPVVFEQILNEEIYTHFLTLHVAITVLSSPNLATNPEFVGYAKKLLECFVLSFVTLYGRQYVSHNVHNLLHLANDVLKFGPLDGFSAFRFENHMTELKKKIRKSEKPLQQLAKRCGELNSLGYLSDRAPELQFEGIPPCQSKRHLLELVKPHKEDEPLPDELKNFEGIEQFKKINLEHFSLKCDNVRDNCCLMSDGTIVTITNFVKFQKQVYVIGNPHSSKSNLYTKPCESRLLNIYVVTFKNEIDYWPVENIISKMQKMPRRNSFVVTPILHTVRF